jgi:hypothetical protein
MSAPRHERDGFIVASASSLNGVSGSGPSDIWAVGQNSGTSFIEH